MNQPGFIKLMRTDESRELMRDTAAFVLLAAIARRARYSRAPALDGIGFGQALIGDHRAYGLTRKQERCARAAGAGRALLLPVHARALSTIRRSRWINQGMGKLKSRLGRLTPNLGPKIE